MARFQTHLADLLSIPESEYARISWATLSKDTGVTINTLKTWYSARVGSDVYLDGFSSATAAKLMAHFGLKELDQLVKLVSE